MKIVKLIYDLETTGLDFRKNAIVQIAGTVLVDDQIKESFDLRMKPFEGAELDPDALRVIGKTEEELNGYGEPIKAFHKFIEILDKYINRYDRNDKAFLVGYNNAKFDDQFLRQWFELNKDRFYGSWFYSNTIDVMPLASQYLIGRRHFMPNFKLSSVADELGITYDQVGLHDALFDVDLTRQIYDIFMGKELEPALERYDYYKSPEGKPFKMLAGSPNEGGSTPISFQNYKNLLKDCREFDGMDKLYDPLF